MRLFTHCRRSTDRAARELTKRHDQIASAERLVVGLPLLREAGHGGRGQAGCGAEEPPRPS
ncbi:hypothetical protein, partial [Streptomyces sp. GESEQ-35]|uniref:hypothetical protein n=1 Tax=Streptomyces sp. GESEQ-35 TaxID=2812657 RepID=UPI001B328D1F